MNEFFNNYVKQSKLVAEEKGIRWATPTDKFGKITKGSEWSLSVMANASPHPEVWLKKLSSDPKTLALYNKLNGEDKEPQPLPLQWQDLIKAVIIQKILVGKNKPAPVKNSVIRPLLALAVIAEQKDPWNVNPQDILSTIKLLEALQPSGKLAKDLVSTSRVVFDRGRLSNFNPIAPARRKSKTRQRQSTQQFRDFLSERSTKEKLPEEEAFWEIARIIWNEIPQSSMDFSRFAIIKTLIIAGLRINEVSSIPVDTVKWIEHFSGVPESQIPKEAIRRTLALTYFASKKRSTRVDSVPLYEAIQYAPQMFESAQLEAFEAIANITTPLRSRLKAQCETGRIFPEFNPNDIVSIFEFYPRLTGEPFIYEDPKESELISKFKATYDFAILDEIDARQSAMKQTGKLKNKFRQYFQMRLVIKDQDGNAKRAPFVYFDGTPYLESRLKYESLYFRVSEIESFLRECMPTKLSDTKPFKLENGKGYCPSQLMFLSPKRALGEERNGIICDLRKYAFVGIITPHDLMTFLSDRHTTTNSIFQKYGNSDASRALEITSHKFRHLQNTELFRLGGADTIITKRFNRNSIAQSHVYDHRTLAENLKAITIPDEAEPHLFGKAKEVYKMIQGGLAVGLIVDEFKSIQRLEGDVQAFKFLAIEADGLHTTPYGHCVNSFTVDPCPKHLECFSGCVHLTRSPLAEHTKNLEGVKKRMDQILNSINDHPAPSGAKNKMREHAQSRKAAIELMLSTPVGEKVFPEGEDFSRPIKTVFSGPFND